MFKKGIYLMFIMYGFSIASQFCTVIMKFAQTVNWKYFITNNIVFTTIIVFTTNSEEKY